MEKNPFQLIKEQHEEWEQNKAEWEEEALAREAELDSKELGGGWY